jgi:hypothetical protein
LLHWAFSGIVGWFYYFLLDKGPQRQFQAQDIGAGFPDGA